MTSLGDQYRDEGIGRAYKHANPAWLRAAEAAITQTALEMDLFTTDEVFDVIDPTVWTHELRAIAGVLRKLQKRKYIIVTDLPMRKTRRPHCHSKKLHIWRSLLR